MRKTSVCVVGILAGLAGSAQAANELQFDVDALSAQATGGLPFSESFTGTLHVYSAGDANARILDLLVDGSAQGTGGASASAGEFDFDLSISFSGGDITGGTVSIKADSSGSENTYTASLSSTSGGAILFIGGGTFIIGGLTFDGLFADAAGTFLGVDVSPWGSVQPVPGRFSEIAFNPNAAGFDMDTDVDVFVTIPLPGAVGMASLGLVGLAARRRR